MRFGGALHLLRMLLSGGADLGDLPFGLRTNLRLPCLDPRLHRPFAFFCRNAERLLRKNAQLRFKVLAQANGRALELGTGLIVR